MKHFKFIGPKTTREFDIEDDEIVTWIVMKDLDYENPITKEMDVGELTAKNMTLSTQNDKIYPTKEV